MAARFAAAVLSIAIIMMAVAGAGHAVARTLPGQVVRVIDGDTVEVLIDQRPVRVRLTAIDAPEVRHGRRDPGQPFGQASRRSLGALIAGHRVTVEDEGTDQYGRMLGTIYDGGRDINAEQVRLGMAWVYRHYSDDPALLALERDARQARRGLWADPDPVPPWEFRHRR
jgi:endonuclease YncB( thermonuclease family)